MHKQRILYKSAFCLGIIAFTAVVHAQPAPAKPSPDSRFGNWLYKKPDPAVWTMKESGGNLVFSASEPPGDYCTLTLFAGAPAGGDFAQQFSGAVAADQQAKGTMQTEADSGPKAGKSSEGYDVLTRSLRSVTGTLHTYHMYVAGHSGDRFDMAAFQTTSQESWNQYGAQASQFLLSLKLANSLPPDQVAKLLGQPTANDAPALPGFDTATPPAATPAATAPAPPAAPVEQAPVTIPDVSLEKSALVHNGVVSANDGKSINGIKLSQHDLAIGSPCIVAGADGVIHVAFVEQHHTTYAYAVYYRSSTDNGKTWSEAKNLSEDMPGIAVGRCALLVDARNRVYVIWRSALRETFPANLNWNGASCCNLMYRTLENGKWSKILPVHPPATENTQSDGSLSFFAVVDAAGNAQVVWNALPFKWHPELTYGGSYHLQYPGVGAGLVFQVTLNGASATAPREIFLSPVSGQKENNPYCDGLDTLNGYADAAGTPHIIAEVTRTHDYSLYGKSVFELIDNGQTTGPMLTLPDLSYHGWSDIPKLLVDAHGRRHIVALYNGGEHPNVRDYLVGSDDDPVIIRAAADIKGTVDGFQGCQGPGGHMIAIMEMNDTGERGKGETYVSTSTGDGWSKPVNVTNNAGRQNFASKQTSSESNVAIEKSCYPGPAVATYDREGHLLLLMINNEYSLFASTAFGVELAGGSTSTPELQFLRF